ncbi:MAG TPA: DUF4040 domain-containing protein [Bacillota bacterium]|nr:DUF4040 domain-containing protein [Bacillota bacterium]HPL99727.1 DUF4040 domain-containing protein [Bacillota bacterium]HPW39948.1 DUF4040 domain-containing protein [Bacillota bacterium]
MRIFSIFMLVFMMGCAVSVSITKNLLAAIIIFASYSLVMAILWQTLNAPDLAITEAAVGAGITTVLFVLTLKRIGGAGK